MIRSCKINKFRCFNSTKATGFAMINLFGGKNNAGKSALLEALLLMGEPSNKSIAKLLVFRGVGKKFIKEMPHKAWENFFHRQEKENEVSFDFASDDKTDNRVVLKCDEDTDVFITMVTDDKEDDDGEIVAFANTLKNTDSSSLHITVHTQEKELQTNVFISGPNGLARKGIPHTFIHTHFVPANSKLSGEHLATEFDKAKLEKHSESLLKAFQIIDATIEAVDTFKIGDAALYLKQKDENYMPLSMFGDAMNRIADFVLRIVNNRNSILLIDEIENGIHYENQEEIWATLFELCEKYNVQLFATSHSYEMIEAFKNVIVKNNFQEHGGYFEMSRHSVSHEITVQKIPIYSLEDKLNNKNPIRGEKVNKREVL